MNRKNEIIINRIRMLQTRLNAGLFKIGLHEDGCCDVCGKLQDCIHFLMECLNTEELRKELNNIPHIGTKWSFQELVSDPEAVQIIIKYINQKEVEI